MVKENIGLLYLSLHNQLKKKVGVNNSICKKKFFEILGKHYLIPKNLRTVVICEMEKRCLVKKESKNSIIVLECKYSIEDSVNGFYRKVGILQ